MSDPARTIAAERRRHDTRRITASPVRAPAAAPAARRTVPFWVWLVAGWAVQAGLRWWLGHRLSVPRADPDEAGYLIAARVLTGGPGADLTGSTFYQGGYPLLLAPVYAVSRDPVTVYRLVLLVNVLARALPMPLLYAAARRLDRARGRHVG